MKEFIFILPNTIGGVSSVVFNLVKFIQHHNVHCKIIAHGEEASNIPVLKTNSSFVYIKFNKNDNLLKKCKILSKYISKNAIIISNDGGIELDAIRFFKLKNPVVYILHGDFNYYYNIIKQKWILMDKIIAVSEYSAKRTSEILSERKADIPIKTIHYPVPTISHSGFSSVGKIRILFVGSLHHRKGIQFFAYFIQLMEKSKIPYHFSIVGTGPMENVVLKLSNNYYNVSYLGNKTNDEVHKIMKENDILFLPSLAEGLPVVVVEAMKCGLVPLVSDIQSGIPEIIFNGKTGFKLPIGDMNAFVHKILYLNANINIFIAIRNNAQQFANKHFDPLLQAEAYYNEFLNTISNPTKHDHTVWFSKLMAALPQKIRMIYKYHIQSVLYK